MTPQEIGRRYDAIAREWDEARSTSLQGLDYLDRAIRLCKMRSRALDVGCGPGGQMMARMIDAGFQVTGIDVSARMLELARARHANVELVHADIRGWTPATRFDLIVAWDSIFHLPHDAHAAVLAKLCASLAEHGVLLFTAGGIDSEIVGNMFGQDFGYSSLEDTTLLELVKRSGCMPVVLERDQYPLHHVVIIAAKGDPA